MHASPWLGLGLGFGLAFGLGLGFGLGFGLELELGFELGLANHRVVAAGGGPLEELVPVIHEALHDEVVGRALLVERAPERELVALVGRGEELEAEPRA